MARFAHHRDAARAIPRSRWNRPPTARAPSTYGYGVLNLAERLANTRHRSYGRYNRISRAPLDGRRDRQLHAVELDHPTLQATIRSGASARTSAGFGTSLQSIPPPAASCTTKGDHCEVAGTARGAVGPRRLAGRSTRSRPRAATSAPGGGEVSDQAIRNSPSCSVETCQRRSPDSKRPPKERFRVADGHRRFDTLPTARATLSHQQGTLRRHASLSIK